MVYDVFIVELVVRYLSDAIVYRCISYLNPANNDWWSFDDIAVTYTYK